MWVPKLCLCWEFLFNRMSHIWKLKRTRECYWIASLGYWECDLAKLVKWISISNSIHTHTHTCEWPQQLRITEPQCGSWWVKDVLLKPHFFKPNYRFVKCRLKKRILIRTIGMQNPSWRHTRLKWNSSIGVIILAWWSKATSHQTSN